MTGNPATDALAASLITIRDTETAVTRLRDDGATPDDIVLALLYTRHGLEDALRRCPMGDMALEHIESIYAPKNQ